MKKTFSSALIALGLSMTIAGVAHANEKLIVYTSMKE